MICFLSADEGCEDLQGVPKGPATNLQTLVGGPAIRLQEDPQSTCKVRVGRCCKFQVLAKHFARGRPNLCPPGRSLLRGDGRPYPPPGRSYMQGSQSMLFLHVCNLQIRVAHSCATMSNPDRLVARPRTLLGAPAHSRNSICSAP